MPTSWSPEEAAVLAAAPTLFLLPGTDPALAGAYGRRGVEVGMVVVEGELYVRAYRGRSSGWFQVALGQRRGFIRTATLDREVLFTRYGGPADAIDAAYTAKYGDYGGLATHASTREATLRISPATSPGLAGPPGVG